MSQPEDKLVSVVLLLKDRPEYTLRWLAYATIVQFPFKILIADGSTGSEVEQLFSSVGAYPELDIDYVRYPADVSRRHFYAKTADAVGRVATPYVMKAANDDFFSVDGIRKSVAYLEANPRFAGARGGIADFTLNPHGVPAADKYIYGRIDQWEKFRIGEKSTDSPRAADRVAAQCAFYITCWHDVNRTGEAAARESALLRCDPVDARVADHVTDFLTVASGPIYRGDYPYMFRQANPRSSEGRSMLDQFKSPAEWMSSSWWQKDTAKMYLMVAQEIHARDSDSAEIARTKFVGEYVDIYLAALRDRHKATSIPFISRIKRLFRTAADKNPIIGLLWSYLAAISANVRIRRARKAITALGWKEEAQLIARFLAAGATR